MKYNVKILLGIIILLGISTRVYSNEYIVGYGLVYSIQQLKASDIDIRFNDLSAGGHSSYFYLEMPIKKSFSILISPGAMNVEDSESQFHVQYNMVVINYKMNTQIFPIAGIGLGACIATLSIGPGKYGETQDGAFLRNTVFIAAGDIGIGYRINDKYELIIKAREFLFFDPELYNMNSLNLGATIGIRLK
jgi:hypothetical protein